MKIEAECIVRYKDVGGSPWFVGKTIIKFVGDGGNLGNPDDRLDQKRKLASRTSFHPLSPLHLNSMKV